jgi:hypothetical protein
MDYETADDIKRHFDVVVEGLRSELGEQIGSVRAEIGGVRAELGEQIGNVRAEIGSVRADLGEQIGSVRADLGEQIGSVRADLGDVRTDLGDKIDRVWTDLGAEIRDVKRHADVVAEGLRGEIRLVAEGVAGLDERFTDEFVKVRAEMHEQIGDVKTLIRVSYADLDRRVKPS